MISLSDLEAAALWYAEKYLIRSKNSSRYNQGILTSDMDAAENNLLKLARKYHKEKYGSDDTQ